MSLGSAVHAALARGARPAVPDNVLANCLPEDKVVVENVLLVAAETVPNANLAATTLARGNGRYRLSLPLAAPLLVTLSQLRAIQTYNPARVAEAALHADDGKCALVIHVIDQATPLTVSEFDVVRVCKRTRWW